MFRFKFQTFFIIIFLNNFCSVAQINVSPKNEFRAVWIATVANIDWPKQRTDSVAKQQTDFLEILDSYKKLNYNAVIVQIRSVGDAFYPSNLAPYSRFLTGREGQEPKSNINMLSWMIAQSHARGLEFHAWFNPYRATSDLNVSQLSSNHDFNLHPDWMIKYGSKFYYNPGLPEVEAHIIKIVEEVVANYDIDAVHFDDYFYPYKIDKLVFDDLSAHQKYGNGLQIDDWRRSNVNNLVSKLNIAIKKIKPYVQFGISPFGVWRNKSLDELGSETQGGQTNYDDLYADTMHWDTNKSIDYILPQLYWNINHSKVSHSVLLDWWSRNTKNVALYIGNGSYRINSEIEKAWKDKDEIFNQINLARSYPNIAGNAYFSAKSFLNKNESITTSLSQNQYKFKAIPKAVPSMQKNLTNSPNVIAVSKNENNYLVQTDAQNARYMVLYATKNTLDPNKSSASEIVDKYFVEKVSGAANIKIPENIVAKDYNYGLTFIDYFGNESQLTCFSFFN